jgi:CheY-like chemotaxis protein
MQPSSRYILCAEPHDDTCYLLQHLLEQAKYQFRSAHSLAEALSQAQSGIFSLFLLSSLFEDGTGVELCERIREADPHTPILFFSSYARESDRQQAICAGAQDYLVKPGDIFELADTIQRLINKAEVDQIEKTRRASSSIDRRIKGRISEPFPAIVFGIDTEGAEFQRQTVLDNFSASGFHLKLGERLNRGAKLGIVVRPSTAPPDKAPAVCVAVNGLVTRTVPQGDGTFGLGIALHNADFFKEWSWSLRG